MALFALLGVLRMTANFVSTYDNGVYNFQPPVIAAITKIMSKKVYNQNLSGNMLSGSNSSLIPIISNKYTPSP
jgi:hypothetical protein